MLEYRSVILQYGVPGLGEVSNYHRETLGLSVRRDEVAMPYTLISSSTLVCTHSSCCSCCDVWGASTAVILLPSDTEYAPKIDDLLLLANYLAGLSALKMDLSKRFSMTDLGEAHYILGIQIDRDRAARTLSISQREYVHKVLQRFGMLDCKAAAIPLPTSIQLTKADSPLPHMVPDAAFVRQYQSAVGALMYAMLGTRPDLAFAVASLSQFSSNPGQTHWDAFKHVLRYMRGTQDYRLTYGSQGVLRP